MFSTGASVPQLGGGGGGAEDKLLEVSLEDGTGGVAVSVRDRLALARRLCRHLYYCDCDPCQKKRAAPWGRAEGGGGGGWAGRVQGVLLQAECDGAGEEGQPEGHQGHQG